jgi:hypothetical protein
MTESRQFSAPPAMPPALPTWLSDAAFAAPVLVTGAPRSGTSMVTGLLGLCGLWLGSTVPGGKENIRGFFENVILRERIQKEILRQGHFDPLGVRILPPSDWHPAVRNFRDAVGAALAAQQYGGGQAWGFKDAKLALTWRTWHEHFPQARWIIVRRPSDEIVASCLRTSFMKQHSVDPAFWRQFVAEYLERLGALYQTTGWCRTIEASDVVSARFTALERVVNELGLTWRPEAVQAFIAPEHWRAPETSAT